MSFVDRNFDVLLLDIDANQPPLEVLITVTSSQSEKVKTKIVWHREPPNLNDKPQNTILNNKHGALLAVDRLEITRFYAREINIELYGGTCSHRRTEIDHWISLSISKSMTEKKNLDYLNNVLLTQTWLVGKKMTLADIHVFSNLQETNIAQFQENYVNIVRWFKFMQSLPVVKDALSLIKEHQLTGPNPRKLHHQGKFTDLPGAQWGKLVVRFPPEASGYLHIGHAKAALLNQYYAEMYNGQLIMRFDDTNPAKETVEFEDAILQDLELLKIKPDRFTHTSDYFDRLEKYCTILIESGKAFVDDTPPELMKVLRDEKMKSENRDNSVEINLQLWEEMRRGTEIGQRCCVRAKIDYESKNGCLRDPTIYRCKSEAHPRTGDKYKVYPTYDFACPLVDFIENVTHPLRTTEYEDRDDQYRWILQQFEHTMPFIVSYSRLNMTHTVLSKRKLTWFVDQGLVDGWDDPRMPTIRGILRHGMTVEALKDFIIAQGSSRSVVVMEWDKIWAFNKKVIDPVAVRYTALNFETTVNVNVIDAKKGSLTVQNHPKDPTKGTKQVLMGPKLLIEREDAECLVEGKNATFINWGNLMILKIHRDHNNITSVDARLNLEDKNYKDTLKITWLAKPEQETEKPNSVLCYAVYFDHLLNVPTLPKDSNFQLFVNISTRKENLMLGEMELQRVKKGEIIQLQRKGFFICDVPYASTSPYSSREQPLILFHIPDGHATTVQKTQMTQKLQEQVDGKKKNDKVKKLKKKEPEIIDLKGSSVATLSQNIQEQIIKVQDLQTRLQLETKILSDMKIQYKNATGQEWDPAAISDTEIKNEETLKTEKIVEEIEKQGDKVRNLKNLKADKSIIDQEVKILLNLKSDYKNATGRDWKPGQITTASTVDKKIEIKEKTSKSVKTTVSDTKTESKEGTLTAEEIAAKIQKQGDKVRSLKNTKADKSTIDQEVKILLNLKNDYKNATGQDWKPGQTTAVSAVSDTKTESKEEPLKAEKIAEEIQKQGDKVRNLKSSKADKSTIDQEVKILLSLKSDYKNATGQDWKPDQTTAVSTVSDTKTENKEGTLTAEEMAAKIQKQGDKVRSLKNSKADKSTIDQEVKILLNLKNDYKNATGQDWKPGQTTAVSAVSNTKTESKEEPLKAEKIAEEIQKQGDKVRNLKSSKADKSTIDQEVKILLSLKSDYKNATGQDWKPGQTPVSAVGDKKTEIKVETSKPIDTVSDVKTVDKEEITKPDETTDSIDSRKMAKEERLFYHVQEHEEFLRNLLINKSSNALIEKATENLAIYEQEYKDKTGQNYKEARARRIQTLNEELNIQHSKLRTLRNSNADKHVMGANANVFSSLRRKYSQLSGDDWKPIYIDVNKLTEEIQKQSDKVQNLKRSKKSCKQEMNILKYLKDDYHEVTGQYWNASNAAADKTADKAVVDISKSDNSKKSRLGLEVKKEENFFEWYSQVITKTGMIEYYDVSGCYILRPWSFQIWKEIRCYIEKCLSEMDVLECYFPIFVTRDALEREKTHIADFAPEVAWVTKCGNSDLAEPVAIRPTSETIMYPAYAKWLRSDTELPLKLNQWNNVVRWEFKDPKPFLRTREFLWQEGHTAYASKAEAEAEVITILNMYATVYEKLLAVPVIKGRKTEKEKFAGAEYTTTVEAFIPTSGRAIQGATSHHLGQNFSKMFNIQVEGITGGNEKTFVYQNSWGLTTRTIGVMIMLHGDDTGLIIPPNIAPIQAIVIPCGISAKTAPEQKNKIFSECYKLVERFKIDGRYKVKGDLRNNRTVGWKYCHWELKGVPVRIELGPKEIANDEVMLVRRDTFETQTCKSELVITKLATLLIAIQNDLFQRAKTKFDERTKLVENWDDFMTEFNKNNLLLAPFCGEPECEDNIKADSASTNNISDEPGTLSMGAKSLCIPFEQPESTTPLEDLTCVHTLCEKKSKYFTLFGRSY